MCRATVRGFISLLVAALFGAAPVEVLAVKPALLTELGLVEALGMVRTRKTFGIRCTQASRLVCCYVIAKIQQHNFQVYNRSTNHVTN